ncbi:MAG: hypothetical protein ABI426_00415 [Flavobacterium sp.]
MKRIILLCCLIFLVSCKKNQTPDVSFYFWKTNLKLTAFEKKTLQENEVSKLYVRYFDVGLTDRKPFPVAPISINENLEKLKIVPVVFFKNEVFLDQEINIETLAQNVLNLICQINAKHKIAINEIQIDCDWSLKSQPKYFEFIEKMKKKSGCKISATIRLHQIKYSEQTKIPNVTTGVLMLYNMGKLAADDKNSIYDAQVTEQYIKSLKKYPLSLKVALPIFSWAIQIRNNQVVNLISKVNNSNFTSDKNFVNYKDNFFKVKENTLKMGLYFKKGDVIKIENVSKENLKEMMKQLHQNLKTTPEEIIYYDLDEINLKQYSNDSSFFKKCNSWF